MPTPHNQLIIVGNPAPNWVKKEFKDDGGRVNKLYEAPTHENKANLPEDYIEEMTKRYPKEWVERFINGSWDTRLAAKFTKNLTIPRFTELPRWRFRPNGPCLLDGTTA